MSTPLMAGISARVVETPRLRTYALTAGDESGAPVVFVHGNVSTTLALMPAINGVLMLCAAPVCCPLRGWSWLRVYRFPTRLLYHVRGRSDGNGRYF